MSKEINKQLTRGFIITFISQYSTVVFQVLIGVILARLLTPEEFGISAIILVFISFFQLISNSFSPGIIQVNDLNLRDFVNLYVLSIIVAISLSILFFGLSYALVYLYSNDVYLGLGKVLSFGVFFCCLGIVPQAILKRNMRFKLLGVIQLCSTLLSGSISIVLAYNGFSYYSVVFQSVISFFLIFILSFVNCKELTKAKYCQVNISSTRASFEKIKVFVSSNIGFDLVNFFSRNLDSLLIGKYIGNSGLALYDKAYRLVLYPVSNLNQVLSRVIHPIFSKFSNEVDVIFEKYIEILYKITIYGVVVSVFCYFSSESIIIFMYGEQWRESIPLFKILSVTIFFQVLQSSTGGVFLATNNPKLYFRSGVIGASMMISCILLGVFIGASVLNVVYFVLCGLILNFIQSFYILINKVFRRSILDLKDIFIGSLFYLGFNITLFQFFSIQFENKFIQIVFNLFLSSISLVILFRKRIFKRN